jgi:threonyl-tRNA synthetase
MAAMDFTFDVMKDFGFSAMEIELSTRPEKYIGTIENCETATRALTDSLREKEALSYSWLKYTQSSAVLASIPRYVISHIKRPAVPVL